MTTRKPGVGAGQLTSAGQRPAEDLPGRQKPGHETEHKMAPFAGRVVAPLDDLTALEPLLGHETEEGDDWSLAITYTKLGTVLNPMMLKQNRIQTRGSESDERPEPEGEHRR